MSVRPVLGLFLGMILTMGCASAAHEDTAGDDSALRALQAGDLDIPVLSATPALDAPEKFADVKSWSVDYVEMTDPLPDNNYKGMMIFGLDAGGQTIYMAPLGYMGADAIAANPGAPSTAVFNMATDDTGSLIPVTFKVSAANTAETIASEQAALDWIVSEQKRLLGVIQTQEAAESSTSGQSFRIQGSFWGSALFCGAHVAAMFLAVNPLTYFVADGAISLIEGAVNSMSDKNKGIKEGAGGMMMAATGGAGKAIAKGVTSYAARGLTGDAAKAAAESAAKRLATKGKVLGAVGVGAAVIYNMVNKKSFTGGLIQTAKDLVPQSCRDTYAAVTSK